MGEKAAQKMKEFSFVLEVPVLPNIYGYTCLDYCLPGAKADHHVDYKIFREDKDQISILANSENIGLGGLIFENITDYGFMHSSPFINSALLAGIILGEDFANKYLAARLMEVDHFFKSKKQYKVKEKRLRSCGSYEYGAVQAMVWEEEHRIKDQLFESSGTIQPMHLRFLDV